MEQSAEDFFEKGERASLAVEYWRVWDEMVSIHKLIVGLTLLVALM
jgi:hypothetical protein